ncbi:ketoacid CoA transferase [Luminiphilus sp.]|nr:ketoacid CoA transferase [Luminiphilus sp.]
MTFSLAELMICAASRSFENEGEVLATGIGLLPRLAASLAMRTSNPDMMMTDSQSFMLSTPNPVSGMASHSGQANENWMGFARIFDNVWSGSRHALVGPSQIDRFGQTNIAALGGSYEAPKVQLLGVRGFPGNSISHANSFFVPKHSTRVFLTGECDVVCSIGYNPDRLPRGYTFDDIDIRRVITDLCVMDFNGPNKQMRVVSLNPGVPLSEVLENTGFEVAVAPNVAETPAPTVEQLALIAELDPLNVRSKQLKDNPPGVRNPN